MLDTLVQLDKAVCITLNHFHSNGLDAIMMAVSGKWTWVPLYALIAWLIYDRFGWKTAAIIVVLAALNVVITDQVSVALKYYFERLRPCHDPSINELLHLADGCGGKFGFVSSHAANTMGLAAFIALVMRKNWLSIVLLLFALLNGYSRIYLGKHFPFDIVGGFLLGAASAALVYWIWQSLIKPKIPAKWAQ